MRDKWTNRGAFILASIGSAVGLGNAWRFPGLCAKYGGILSDITITSLHDEIENEQAIEQALRNSIRNEIVKRNRCYFYLSSVSDFLFQGTKTKQNSFLRLLFSIMICNSVWYNRVYFSS